MKQQEAMQRMQEIQRIMERTTLYTLLPGKEAVIGRVLALLGCAASYGLIRSVDFGVLLDSPYRVQILFCVMWAVVGVSAIAQDVILLALAARRQGVSPASRPSLITAYALSPSVVVAAIITLKILMDVGGVESTGQNVRYIAPIWMMCYGTGVFAAGLFSVRLPRLLGLAFIVTGAAGMLFFEKFGLILVALSFGLMHIVFGLEVIRRARRP